MTKRKTTSRGRFIVVVGPDGSGKTTVARELLRSYDGSTAYFHFRPPFRGPMIEIPPALSQPPPSKGSRSGSVPMGWVRLAVNFVRFWAGYLRRVAPARRRGALVVGDRWAYGYLAQPYALKYYGPDWLARAVIRALPQPDLVVNLAAPAEIIHDRKQELSIADIRSEMGLWGESPSQNLRSYDATLTPTELVARIGDQLGIHG